MSFRSVLSFLNIGFTHILLNLFFDIYPFGCYFKWDFLLYYISNGRLFVYMKAIAFCDHFKPNTELNSFIV